MSPLRALLAAVVAVLVMGGITAMFLLILSLCNDLLKHWREEA